MEHSAHKRGLLKQQAVCLGMVAIVVAPILLPSSPRSKQRRTW